MANDHFKVELSAEQKSKLAATGSHIDLSELGQNQYSLRDVARICDMADAWVRLLLKNGKIQATKGEKGRWQVSRAEVARVRQEQIDKRLNRLDRPEGSKKYIYRSPSQWTVHLMTKAINNDQTLSADQKKLMRTAMNRYKADWEQAAKVRAAKKEANKAAAAKDVQESAKPAKK